MGEGTDDVRMAANSSESEQLYAPFVPQRARRVAGTVAVVEFALFLVIALTLPGEGLGAFHWYDRAGVIIVAGLVAWLLWRFARVRAVPSRRGLAVRNLMRSATLEWTQIVAVRFGGGAPWVSLDLDDGETVAVMAVQRADGPAAQGQAKRLATLVALHSRTSRDD